MAVINPYILHLLSRKRFGTEQAAKRAKESVRQFCLRAIQREIEKDGK